MGRSLFQLALSLYIQRMDALFRLSQSESSGRHSAAQI
jgi:hypothetical protein